MLDRLRSVAFFRNFLRLGVFSFLLFVLICHVPLTQSSSALSSYSFKDFDKNEKEYLSFTSKILSDKEDSPRKKSSFKVVKLPNKKLASKSSPSFPHGRTLSKSPPKKLKAPHSHNVLVNIPNKNVWFMKDPGPAVDRLTRKLEEGEIENGEVVDPPASPAVPEKTSPAGKSSTTTEKPTKKKTSNSTNHIRVVIYSENAEVDPQAPGWFALKTNNNYGKELKLGVLLRKFGPKTSQSDFFGDDFDESEPDASDKFSYMNRRYDKACSWLEYIDTRDAIQPSTISDPVRELIAGQNRLLADFFLNITFNVKPDDLSTHPLTTIQEPKSGIELLMAAKDIFHQQICVDREYDEEAPKYNPDVDKLLPRTFVDTIVLLFLKLHELTSSTEAKDYLEPSEVSWIKSYLTECKQADPNQSKKLTWFPDECNERVIAFDQSNNFACTPYPEFDFNVRKHDPILDTVWHIVTAVQAHCFESFQTNIRMWHRFALAIVDLFPPQMRIRWSASSEENAQFYKRLFGPNYQIYFDNMNRCLYASTLRSNVPYLVPRFEGHRRTQYAPKKYHTLLPPPPA